MTEKLFWQDPYLNRLETRISTISAGRIHLEKTIFYAASGGQESDHGTIAGRQVVAAHHEGLDLSYTLESIEGMAAGDPAVIELDWSRRHALMRLHFAAELVLELIRQQLPGIQKIGAHIAQDKARIDFSHAQSIASLLETIEPALGDLISADLPVCSAFSDPLLQRRYWEIADFARVPCGGTHVRRTGEVGPLLLKRKNIGKGKERVEIRLAGQADDHQAP